jgi:hypothetical protein
MYWNGMLLPYNPHCLYLQAVAKLPIWGTARIKCSSSPSSLQHSSTCKFSANLAHTNQSTASFFCIALAFSSSLLISALATLLAELCLPCLFFRCTFSHGSSRACLLLMSRCCLSVPDGIQLLHECVCLHMQLKSQLPVNQGADKIPTARAHEMDVHM